MKIYTYSEARQNRRYPSRRSGRKGEVRIRRRDGKSFIVRPEQASRSPFDVEGADPGLKREQILRAIYESRKK